RTAASSTSPATPPASRAPSAPRRRPDPSPPSPSCSGGWEPGSLTAAGEGLGFDLLGLSALRDQTEDGVEGAGGGRRGGRRGLRLLFGLRVRVVVLVTGERVGLDLVDVREAVAVGVLALDGAEVMVGGAEVLPVGVHVLGPTLLLAVAGQAGVELAPAGVVLGVELAHVFR